MYDVALALGVEKLYHEDKRRSFQAIGAALDVEWVQQIMARLEEEAAAKAKEPAGAGAGQSRSMFMDLYAALARNHMQKYGTTKEQFAKVAVKNHYHGVAQPARPVPRALHPSGDS